MLFNKFSIACVISIGLVTAASAQDLGGVDTGGFGGIASDALNDTSVQDLKDKASTLSSTTLGTLEQIKALAANVITSVNEGGDFCERLGSEARIDCLAESYEVTAKRLSNSGAEAEMKKAFENAAKQLRKIVSSNIDRAKNPIIPTVRTRKINRRATRPLRSVKSSSLARTNVQADKVLKELATLILRSNSRSLRYVRMARSVEANRILLRS
jgi:hypothetical protein